MHHTRSARRLVVALLAGTLLLGATAPAVLAKDGGNKDRDRAEHAQDRDEKARRRAGTELKGAVATVDTTAGTFELQVSATKRVTVKPAPEAYLTVNDRKTTLTDLRAGDAGKVTGLLDSATGRLTAYLLQFTRTAPAPAQVKGPVAAVTATTFTLTVKGLPVLLQPGTPSILTLNGQPTTLADVHVGDKGEATAVAGVAYVARFTRALPPTPTATKLEGTVTSVSPLVLFAKGMSVPVQVATPSIVALNDAPATLAEVHVGDRCTVVGLASPGGLTAFYLAFRRP
ncbi:MAG: hypothetical protein JWO68_2774 [Actinomycetia bacterium]|nr:hypothetical protein [Actinomycetes bacterium]